ncbi:FliM/FliN family flagellar motor switch protein, partial [Pseudomonas asplenii]|uniref:FliM/FliN family flagellar motor switch protein n=1 Tax=Pseudomonas asplenii TaxID=53407 RepID=UPI00037CBC6E
YSPWLRNLPHCLRATLGYSRLPSAALPTLVCGDVLRISRLTRHWQLADQPVGEFTLIEQGLHMTLSSNIPDTPPAEPCAALGSLPVRLEFVLHERHVSLAELAALVEGQVLALEPSVLGDIEIRANGRALACGELVRLGGGLGVELRQIRRECADEQ